MQTLWLLGGLGLGAGLMYLLDPEKGAERRDVVRGHVVDYGRQTGDLLDHTRRTLGRQAQAVLPRTRVPFRHQPGLEKRLLTQAEEMGLPLGLCLLGCVGLGVGRAICWNPRVAHSGVPGCARKGAPTGIQPRPYSAAQSRMERTLPIVDGGRTRTLRTRHEVPHTCTVRQACAAWGRQQPALPLLMEQPGRTQDEGRAVGMGRRAPPSGGGVQRGSGRAGDTALCCATSDLSYRFWIKANNFQGLFQSLPHYVATIKLSYIEISLDYIP